MSNMRAKFQVTRVQPSGKHEAITMTAVSEKPFDPDGKSEDNSFARWTPSGELKMTISNPELLGKIKEDQRYYLDFTLAEEPKAAAPAPAPVEAPDAETAK